MDNKEKFVPYVSANSRQSELTVTSILTGIILAVVFGAANAYLGLRVGMTVSASIPAAVVSMGVIRVLLKRNSILESNIVQTIGSAGESLAAGAIFTIPALFLWASEGKMPKPDITYITVVSLCGGILGVLFMIPLRKNLIVREHGNLPYPEGKACAAVLMAGEKESTDAKGVFIGMGFAAIAKIITDGLRLASGEISVRIKGYAGEIGTQVYPAVLSVGYICGPKVASYMFSGGVVSWLVFIPLVVLFGKDNILYPASVPIGTLFAQGGASAIWSTYIRYIGAGALATGGIISLAKSFPIIVNTVRTSFSSFGKKSTESTRTSRDINTKLVFCLILIFTVFVWLTPQIPVTFGGAVIVAVFGFLFAAVSSRMVGLVGSSNNPVSGMAIATLLITTLILKITGAYGTGAMASAIAIGSVICIISAIAGDTSQDLKTGYILGATPQKQQIGEFIGVISASLAIGATLYLLDSAWGFGSKELGAPQATLMKLIIEGVMDGNLPWGLVMVGVFIAITVEILRIPVLPFAIGLYLPVQLNACIMVGGILRSVVQKSGETSVNRGVLYCSGMIAGEGIAGIALAIVAILGFDSVLDISKNGVVTPFVSNVLGLVLFAVIIASVLWYSTMPNKKKL